MVKIQIIVISFLVCWRAHAQQSSALTPSQFGSIQLIEKKMQRIGLQFLSDTNQSNRLKGAREFVKLLVEALKVENSFQYPFDSIPYLAKVVPDDKALKVFTFQVMLDNYTFIHYGCIQLNRKNIKLIPFKDFSDTFMVTPQFTISNKNWLGAVYYKAIMKTIDKKPVYFLFGYDQNDLLTDKKYIEAMWIEKDSIARFGMPLFEKTITEILPQPKSKLGEAPPKPVAPRKITKNYYRYVLEYRKKASVNFRYDKSKDIITHDHITPLDPKYSDAGFMKVPDGSYEGLRWNGNKWIWIDYVPVADKETNDPIRPVPSKSNKLEH